MSLITDNGFLRCRWHQEIPTDARLCSFQGHARSTIYRRSFALTDEKFFRDGLEGPWHICKISNAGGRCPAGRAAPGSATARSNCRFASAGLLRTLHIPNAGGDSKGSERSVSSKHDRRFHAPLSRTRRVATHYNLKSCTLRPCPSGPVSNQKMAPEKVQTTSCCPDL